MRKLTQPGQLMLAKGKLKWGNPLWKGAVLEVNNSQARDGSLVKGDDKLCDSTSSDTFQILPRILPPIPCCHQAHTLWFTKL